MKTLISFYVATKMRNFIIVLFLFMVHSSLGRRQFQTKQLNPIITLDDGQILGRYAKTFDQQNEYVAYLGIPYAQPPIGDLRFEPPVPARKWSNLLNATMDKPRCVQGSGFDIIGSEDCLHINVYTPKMPNKRQILNLLSVVVHIYGGGFNTGQSDYDLYNPELFLNENVIYVSFNYRLGIFGFISTNDLVSPGNNGLRDQILALKWVQKNIIKFGGDPEQVTILGISAGSASTSYMMQTPLAKGLFRGVISESGTSLCMWSLARNLKSIVALIGTVLFIDTSTSQNLITGLRRVNYKKLQIVSGSVTVGASFLLPFPSQDLIFAPVIEPNHENAVVKEKSFGLLSSGNYTHVPQIIGFNSNEGGAYIQLINQMLLYSITFDWFPEKFIPIDMNDDKHLSYAEERQVGKIIKTHYFGNGPVGAAKEALIKYASDVFFVTPITQSVKQQSKHNPVYFYEFTYEGNIVPNKTGLGVWHGEEAYYIFRLIEKDGTPVPLTPNDALTRKRLMTLWTNFIKYGNPTPSETRDNNILQNLGWPTSDTGNNSLAYLEFGKDLNIKLDPHKESVAFWDNLYTKYGKRPFDTY